MSLDADMVMQPIDWEPAIDDEVIQNVRTIFATTPGTVPLARALGTDNPQDDPTLAAIAKGKASLIRAVKTYEPRVGVKSVTESVTPDGQLVTKVRITEP